MQRNARKGGQSAKLKRQGNASVHEPPSRSAQIATAAINSGRSCLRRFSDNLSYMKYVIFIFIVPPILNLSFLKQEALYFYSEGTKVDMGWGQRIHISCKGTGVPTVILDSPTGSNSDIWYFVHEQLAAITQVCVYDRSGIGNSDSPFSDVSSPQDYSANKRYAAPLSSMHQMVNDLHHLITKANPLPHPYIIVGSEIGALVARTYAAIHPELVSDIVLIDPLVENLLSDNEDFAQYWYSKLLPTYEVLHLSAAVGLSRIAFMLDLLQPKFFDEEVPVELLKRQKILLCNPWHINAAFYEHLNLNLSLSQMSHVMSMNQIPERISISVIRRDEPDEIPPSLREAWKKSQDHLVSAVHPSAQTFLVQEKGFHKMYSSSSPVIEIIKGVIESARQKIGGFRSLGQ